MFEGHSASRKSCTRVSLKAYQRKEMYVLGGPEMYKVARSALTAGVPGKRKENIWDEMPELGTFSPLRW